MHSLPPKAKSACIATIVLANAAIVALGALSLLSGGCTLPVDSEPGPVEHWELEGTWCDTRSPQTCLTVRHGTDDPFARYELTVGLCSETGRLTGGLEFSPDTSSRICLPGFTYGLWSAAAAWTPTGLTLEPNQSDGTTEGTVYHPTLELDYVR